MRYRIRCLETSQILVDDGFILVNPATAGPALLRAEYQASQLNIRPEQPGLFRFADWLPVSRVLPSAGYPVTFRSERLASVLGLENLYITFSGYWPARGAFMTTGSFKECEAYTVCARYPQDSQEVLVVASAGNTARAFLKVASENRVPLVVVVPQSSLNELWQEKPLQPWVRIVAAAGDSDYFDAIQISDKVSVLQGFKAEGGARNIARRDGMGTTLLSAATTIGQIPDCYFQAIGSGTGAIAAHEANLRLLGDGRYGHKLMQLHLSQNSPFLPIFQAWQTRRREIAPMDTTEARRLSQAIDAKVLANRKPPYGLTGGLFDALSAAGGHVYAVDNTALAQARDLFAASEGCDVCPEAGVALASLIEACEKKLINRQAVIMLNVTGGGLLNIKKDLNPQPVIADLLIDPDDIDQAQLAGMLAQTRQEILASLTS